MDNFLLKVCMYDNCMKMFVLPGKKGFFTHQVLFCPKLSQAVDHVKA